jgi:hypothetical protein
MRSGKRKHFGVAGSIYYSRLLLLLLLLLPFSSLMLQRARMWKLTALIYYSLPPPYSQSLKKPSWSCWCCTQYLFLFLSFLFILPLPPPVCGLLFSYLSVHRGSLFCWAFLPTAIWPTVSPMWGKNSYVLHSSCARCGCCGLAEKPETSERGPSGKNLSGRSLMDCWGRFGGGGLAGVVGAIPRLLCVV